jgi:hypothetical protein
MKTRSNIFLRIFFVVACTVQYMVASSLFLQDAVNFDNQIMTTIMQSSFDDELFTGSLTDYFDQLRLDFQRKVAQDLLCLRDNRNGYFFRSYLCGDKNQDALSDKNKQLKKTRYIFSLMILLCSYFSQIEPSQNKIVNHLAINTRHRSASDPLSVDRKKHPKYNNPLIEEQENSRFIQPVQTDKSLQCCGVKVPETIRSLPVIYATNIAGNLVAIGIACFAPNPAVGCAASAIVGCAGGCLEGLSTNQRYFSHATHVFHNNLCTGYVADQVTGSCGSAFEYPVANAAAVGSVVGYTGALATTLVARQCYKKYKATRVSQHCDIAHHVVSEQMER